MGETLNLNVCVDKLSGLLENMNNCIDNMQNDSINLLNENMEKCENEINNLSEKIENSKTPNIFVSLFSKLFSLFSKKEDSEKSSEETLFESKNEKQKVDIENEGKTSLISRANDAKNLNNKNEININNEEKGVEI